MHGPHIELQSQLRCRFKIQLRVRGWNFCHITGRSRFNRLLFCVFALLDLCVMDLLSSNVPPVETPPA